MTALILDPALFMDSIAGLAAIRARDDSEYAGDLDGIVRVLQVTNGYIPKDQLWLNIERRLIVPLLHKHLRNQRFRQPLAIIRDRLRPIPVTESKRVTVWSFRDLFACLGGDWTDLVVLSAASLLSSGESTTLVVVRRILGRNLIVHGSPPGALQEKCIWNLRMLTEHCFSRMLCVANERNIKVPWTCRYDDRLPAPEDGAAYPFCAPINWFVAAPPPRGRAVRLGAHPGSEDIAGRVWTRPDGLRGLNHWDVQIPPRDRSAVGSPYLNVTIGWPLDKKSKPPGTIDHGHVPPFSKWAC